MKKFFKENWKFILFVVIAGIIGGYFSCTYLYASLSEEMLMQLQEQNVTKDMYVIISTIQIAVLYGFVLCIIGIILSKKVGLWKEFKIYKKAIILTLIFGILGGIVLFPGDKILFGSSEFVSNSYTEKPTLDYFLSSLFYGGVIEEVMMRLFFMSLLVYIISKIFCRNKEEIPTSIYVIANIIVAVLFAAGHIPSTMSMTILTPILLVRCFALNGAYGLIFGYLYRKHGIGYSMACHGLCHFVSKILMYMFI